MVNCENVAQNHYKKTGSIEGVFFIQVKHDVDYEFEKYFIFGEVQLVFMVILLTSKSTQGSIFTYFYLFIHFNCAKLLILSEDALKRHGI